MVMSFALLNSGIQRRWNMIAFQCSIADMRLPDW